MSISKSLKTRLIVFFAAFMAVWVALNIYSAQNQFNNAITAAMNQFGVPVVHTASSFIDGDKFEKLAYSLDENDPFYEEIRVKLNALLKESDMEYLYTMAKYPDGTHRFIVDGSDPDSESFSDLGAKEDISEYSIFYLLAYSTGKPQCDRIGTTTKWGKLLSYYQPIFNSKGEVVGIIGCDFNMGTLSQNISDNTVSMISTMIIIGLSAFTILVWLIYHDSPTKTKKEKKSQRAENSQLGKNFPQIAFIFVGISLLTATSYITISILTKHHLETSAKETLKRAETNIEMSLEEPKTMLVTATLTFLDLLAADRPVEDAQKYTERFTDWLNSSVEEQVAVFNGLYGMYNGTYIDGNRWIPDADYVVSERPWYKTAVKSNGEITMTEPYVDAETGNIVISYSQLIDGTEGKETIISMDVMLYKVSEYTVAIEISKGGFGILFDDKLQIIAHPDNNLIGNNMSEISSEYAFVAERIENGSASFNREVRIAEGEKAMLFLKQMSRGWYIALVAPTRTYYGATFYVVRLMLLIFGVLLSLVLCYIVIKLNERREKSEQQNVAKSTFLATMSHEIRTPMNVVVGIADMQLARKDLPQEYKETFKKIRSSGNNLLGIINDILDLSKIEAGKLEIYTAEYNLPSLINDSVQLNVVRIGKKKIRFALNAESGIPQRVIGDELRIKQILNNVLSNAFKYTDAGEVTLKISAAEGMNANSALLSFTISDTGQGMKPEDLEKLFGEYTRFNSSENKSNEGTGLGMSIVQNLVRLMGGQIYVNSVYGKGSVFEILIPQTLPDDFTLANGNVIGAATAEKLNTFSYYEQEKKTLDRSYMPYGKVLIVDDVDTNLYVASGLLAPYGIQTDCVLSGYDALKILERGTKSYDIIFLDHMMPGMDGIETCKRLRQYGVRATICALTANALIGSENVFLDNGFDDFISKPIDLYEMDKILNKYVRDIQPREVLIEAAQKADVTPEEAKVRLDAAIEKIDEQFASGYAL